MHCQGLRLSWASKETGNNQQAECLPSLLFEKVEAVCSSKMSVNYYQTT
jgi:hypothetical protein